MLSQAAPDKAAGYTIKYIISCRGCNFKTLTYLYFCLIIPYIKEMNAMEIRKAEAAETALIKELTHRTISAVYPHYYPEGAVRFFLEHHSEERIMRDINAGEVYLLTDDSGQPAGTVTVNGNEINRLFVLPEFQGKGLGGKLIAFAEKLIEENYSKAELSASFPAKAIYLKKGYRAVEFHSIPTENGDYLCYDYMKKELLP